MGTFNPAASRPELRDAVRGVGPGQVSPVARIPSGYAVLKVMEKGSTPVKDADAARNFALAATGAVKTYSMLMVLAKQRAH
jgi:hypothetical protein